MYKVGLSSRVTFAKDYFEPRDCISHDWLVYLSNQNISITIIPNISTDFRFYVDEVDLVILTGGDNISKLSEKDTRSVHLEKRDANEAKIIRYCSEIGKPLFGVCRGMQLINIFFGGSITPLTDKKKHVNCMHKIAIKNLLLTKLFGRKLISVNSFHNNGISLLADSLEIMAESEDGNIESFVHRELPICGVMWHPERHFDDKFSQSSNNNFVLNLVEVFLSRQ